ncbi:MAG: 30S ribosomal protein S15 [Mycoplasmataceae bacterium]|jgi:small subunit ribosomal protein S15|nr:30S ribosomal protein S15 [Mycoplasmataceae bacterium]
MALSKKQKAVVIKEFSNDKKNTGLTEVQIALLTKDIASLTLHIQTFPKDFSCKRGLYQKVSKRRRLLNYLKRDDITRYHSIIKLLDLRS